MAEEEFGEMSPEKKKYITEITEELHQYLDIPLTVTAVLGSVNMEIRDILKLKEGQVVELDVLVGEPIEIYINNLLTARGETVVINERFGVRVTDVIDPMEIIRAQA